MTLLEAGSGGAPEMAALAACCRWPEFAPRLVALGPFPDADAVVAAAGGLVAGLPDPELRAVLTRYPPLGSPPTDHPAAGALSRSEEAGLHASGPAVVGEVRALAARYRERFGYTYLVAAQGRSGHDLLADLRERLQHDPPIELATARRELVRKVGLRVRRLFPAADQPAVSPSRPGTPRRSGGGSRRRCAGSRGSPPA